MPERARAGVEIRLLGPFVALAPNGPLRLGSRRERALLALLALRLGSFVPFARLVRELWGEEAPASAAATLRTLLSRLRHALAESGAEAVLERVRELGYRLDMGREHVDALRFEHLLRDVRTKLSGGATSAAAADLESALGLWRGPPLGEFADYAFAQLEAARLEELRLEAVEELVEAQLTLGLATDALALVRRQVADNPYRERAWGLLMTALYRLGRQAEALRAYQRLRTILAELGIEPSPALRQLERQILIQSPGLPGLTPRWVEAPPAATVALPTPLRARPHLPGSRFPAHPAPPPRRGTLGGRERELQELAGLVQTCRLITLTGSGGLGKTDLAIEVAARAEGHFPDGTAFVELGSLNDPELLGDQLLSGLGAAGPGSPAEPSEERLVGILESRTFLLVLDGCDRLAEPVADIAGRLLSRCPGVSVLATSRRPLGAVGEITWPVTPLSLPDLEARSPDQIGRSGAVFLFCERAQAADSGFWLTPDNAPLLGQICRQLDGIPLALELAAARLRVLSIEQLTRRLDEHFRLVSDRPAVPTGDPSEVHRTLKAAVDWSHELLSFEERLALRRLSVFPAGFDLGAAERVIAEGGTVPAHDVLGLLGDLIDKSLLFIDRRGPDRRYRLSETVREYALERLERAGESGRARGSHRDFYLDLVRRCSAGDPRRDTGEWLRRFALEHDNLRAALEWSMTSGAVDLGLEIAGTLRLYWLFGGHFSEASYWYERALARSAGPPSPARISALNGLGLFVGRYRGDPAQARRLHQEALRSAEEIADRLGAATARFHLGMLALQDVSDEAERLLEEARQGFVDAGWPATAAWCEVAIGFAALERGDPPAAELAFAAGLDAGRRHGSDDTVTHALAALGLLAALRGESEPARLLAEEALSLARALDLDEILVMTLVRVAEVATLAKRFEPAEEALLEALTVQLRTGCRTWVADCFELLALNRQRQGHPQQAALLLGACEAMRTAMQEEASERRWIHAETTRCRAEVSEAIGGGRFDQQWEIGAGMTMEQAVSYVLG